MRGTKDRIRLDLSSTRFQEQLFAHSKQEQYAVLTTLRKLSQMSRHQVY